jgi:hypothetical protein
MMSVSNLLIGLAAGVALILILRATGIIPPPD